MSLHHSILTHLCDGHFHSGEALARQLQVSRAAIWKAVRQLTQQYGVRIDAVQGKGYRFVEPFELLNQAQLGALLSAHNSLEEIEVLFSVDSTNRYLLDKVKKSDIGNCLVLAEHQSAGRGRRGRQWCSPLSGNIYFSLHWSFQQTQMGLSGLSLVAGVAVVEALEALGINDIALKWPNDILCQGKKLGGILVEVMGEISGNCSVIIGVGINVHLPQALQARIEQACIDLGSVMQQSVSRNQLAATLVGSILASFSTYNESGLDAFVQQWRRYDYFADKHVDVLLGKNRVSGIARGIDDYGALLVELNGKLQRYMSGEISLRQSQVAS